MLERFFEWLVPNESSELRARRVQGARGFIALTAVIGIIYSYNYVRSHPLIFSTSGSDWLALVCGVFFAYLVALDLRSGRSSMSEQDSEGKHAYIRSANPVSYWILIALKGAIAAGLVVGSLRGLLGLWK